VVDRVLNDQERGDGSRRTEHADDRERRNADVVPAEVADEA
jgi:hypothetical protein